MTSLKYIRCFKGVLLTYNISSKRYSTFYVTTPIFYVNASPHLGHLYSALLADATHRFHGLTHPIDQTIFSTGTDEHGLKIEKAASLKNVPVDEYCQNISAEYKALFDMADIQYTHFIRTTDENHINSVKHFWNVLKSKNTIYSGNYSGWYCVSDETFLSENQLKIIRDKNENEIKVSEESGHPVEWTDEQNYMFKLSSYRSDLLYWLQDEKRIVPSKFYKQLRDWLSDENVTRDISISRPIKRIRWGIPVPDDNSQIIYVWLDALVSYLTNVGYPNSRMWPPSVHVCGKDILKFHGIYWPAFLIAAGLEPPNKLFIHSHWTVDNEKMSKSKNNVVNPVDKIKTYSSSGFRYFLLREGVPHNDGNYRDESIINLVNAELANKLGNLLNRCTGKALNPAEIYPQFNRAYFNQHIRGSDSLYQLSTAVSSLSEVVHKHYSEFNYYKGLEEIITVLQMSNKFFEDSKPWELKYVNDKNLLNCILHISMESLRICGIALQPVIPKLAENLLNKLSVPKEHRLWSNMKPTWEQLGDTSANSLPLLKNNVILYKKLQMNK